VVRELFQLVTWSRIHSGRGGQNTAAHNSDARCAPAAGAAATANVDYVRDRGLGAVRENNRAHIVCVRVTEDARKAVLGETVGQVQHKWLVLHEAGQRCERLPEALAGNLEEPVGPEAPMGAVADGVPGALRDTVARDDGNFANATIVEPVECVGEERAVREGDERRCEPPSVVGLAGEQHSLRGPHAQVTARCTPICLAAGTN